ncbi:unnamed protein product [Miscanthus lutarioriparius]|uniref:Uncharacterized protein n=1 Tax=Miscanthus lutarioriparius TaxID=422564 RepID=A0A811N810_9POAL|nr:unnamed protein product [Miscanthus lutarioriparius]
MVMMSRVHYFLTACVSLLPLSAAESGQTKEPYVVYMGRATTGGGGSSDPEAVRAAHLQLLSSVIPSDEQPERLWLRHSYHHAFEGFATLLTQEEATTLSGHERVVSVFRDRVLQLHTTRSWDFLDAQSGLWPDRLSRRASGDVISGVVDTGVWPESPSFNDAGMPERKLIGAGYYDLTQHDDNESSASTESKNASRTGAATGGSPRDTHGHGTHTASTAASAAVPHASYHGLARGTAKGGAPASRVAVWPARATGAQAPPYSRPLTTPTQGVAINFSNQCLSGGRYPVVFGRQVAARHTTVFDSSNCYPGSLDARKVAGKIVVCIGTDRSVPRRVKPIAAEQAGARGLPDVMAPGVDILATVIPSMDKDKQQPSAFAIQVWNTSMDCPHVAGAAAFLKSAHPGWSPSMIRSALMTTATSRNNLGEPLASSAGTVATGHDMGAGEVSPLRALSPGLVFDTTTDDYLDVLCYYGYDDKRVRKISGVARFACPADAPSEDLVAARVNYPSISVRRLHAGKVVTVARTVTNVGSSNDTTYKATVETPLGLTVHVVPERLVFSHRGATAKFEVTSHDGNNAAVNKGYAHGAVTWSDGAHSVRLPFAVHAV